MESITQEEIPTSKIDILTHSSNSDLNTTEALETQQIGKDFENYNDQDDKTKTIEVLQQEVGYLRQLFEFQNSKIEKLTSLVTEFIENKNHDSLISSIQQLHEHNQQQSHQLDSQQHQQLHHHHLQTRADDQHPQLESQQHQQHQHQLLLLLLLLQQQQQQQQQQQLGQPGNLDPNVAMDSNMDPALHRVAIAAVAAAERDKPKKPFKRKLSETNFSNPNVSNNTGNNNISPSHNNPNPNNNTSSQNSGDYESKKPKIEVSFLHNPTTVKEIYDEFTKGFKGQPPLCEMDTKYGKHEWRGDSRSKESKRYQRRKKLCDAIERGMIKYNKSAEEIIAYIEEFRGDKSLTWVMNGNLPPDIANN